MKTTTTWRSEKAFKSTINQTSIEIDGGGGFNPKALLLSGLAGCAGIDVVMILEKMKVSFADLEIEAEADQTDTVPKIFKDILVTFHIKTDSENEDKVRKAIELSLEKYCGVAAMLKKNSDIRYNLIIQPE